MPSLCASEVCRVISISSRCSFSIVMLPGPTCSASQVLRWGNWMPVLSCLQSTPTGAIAYSLAPKEVIIACSQALQPSLLGHRPPTASPMTSPPPRPAPCLPPWSPAPPLLQSKAPCQLPPSSPCLPRPRPHLHNLPQSQRYASGVCQAQQPVALLVVQDLLNDASVAQYLLLCIPGWDARSASCKRLHCL